MPEKSVCDAQCYKRGGRIAGSVARPDFRWQWYARKSKIVY
ncbi:hypothetical protein [Siphonobacter sp. SORGH_AS_0500]|nr:hypothetical protein [Siphonobacter sp. SORGH_AS_0500]MDR6197991.1 hypothetical protein [Siphonobacter sp. SORGH_AS_0500]